MPLRSRVQSAGRLAAAALLALAGCSGPNVVTVPIETGSAHVEEGEVLKVDLGVGNPSVGDQWFLVEPPDPAVLSDGERTFDPECDQPGCGGRTSWTFTARSKGSATVVFRYCYRSQPDNCQAEPHRGPSEPVEFTVTVGPP